jgi:hypothetical protein
MNKFNISCKNHLISFKQHYLGIQFEAFMVTVQNNVFLSNQACRCGVSDSMKHYLPPLNTQMSYSGSYTRVTLTAAYQTYLFNLLMVTYILTIILSPHCVQKALIRFQFISVVTTWLLNSASNSITIQKTSWLAKTTFEYKQETSVTKLKLSFFFLLCT